MRRSAARINFFPQVRKKVGEKEKEKHRPPMHRLVPHYLRFRFSCPRSSGAEGKKKKDPEEEEKKKGEGRGKESSSNSFGVSLISVSLSP